MSNQPLADAFLAGSETFLAGLPENNPYGVPTKQFDDMATQWQRGYRNTRKWNRFNATIKARRGAMETAS
jgi:hypothetical protein